MKTQSHLQIRRARICAFIFSFVFITTIVARAADPRTNSWFTTFSGRYARLYTSDTAKSSGDSVTTWTNGTTTQSLPTYCGVQDVYSSSNWVYIRTTGLGSFIMGPWYLNSQHTQMFPNWPVNQKVLFRIPRHPTVPTAKSITGAGAVGYFVDGVAMFNSWDAHYWNGSADVSYQGTDGYWNRDAYVNESATFDPGNAHQANGQYHYHANPPALRYLLGDHVNYDSVTGTYSEDTNPPTQHSPILGWVADGYPIYGPYGYSNPTNPASGIRRMISGYVPRNGQHGTDNLSTNGAVRATIPAWAQRVFGVSANQAGPTVSTSYPFGRYMEDNAYLGDLTNPATGSNYQQGADFDLDEYNGRWCVTPEFPNGTYAYFVSIASDGTPEFPYNIGRGFYGDPTGGTVSAIAETVATNFVGGPAVSPVLKAPTVQNQVVTLSWSAAEGGTYTVESTTNLSTWTTNSDAVPAVLNTATYTNNSADNQRFYRVAQTGLADYDPVTGNGATGGGQVITLTPNSGSAGSSFAISATISAGANPAPPPHTGAPVASFTIGNNTVTGTSYTYNADGSGTVTGSVTSLTGSGNQAATITFSPPPGQSQGPTYTQTGAFTIQ